MNIALDTSAYSAAIVAKPELRKWFSKTHHLFMPIIVIAELRSGFANGLLRERNESLLKRFLSSADTDILHITEETTNIYAEIFKELRRIGRPINSNDMWVAAICIENKLPLLTLDGDFKNISKLKLMKP